MPNNQKLYEAIRSKSDKRWKIWDIFHEGEEIHVADVADYDEKKDQLRVVRMFLANFRNIPVSLTFLKPPETGKKHRFQQNSAIFDSFDQLSDTSNWKVDKTTLFTPLFATALIESMFLSGAVEPDYQTKAKVLQIGIGGGGVYNFIEAAFPNIDLTGVELSPVMLENAKKWFQLKTSPSQRCYVADGIAFVAEAVENGEKYDAIIVDAAYNGFQHAGKDNILAPVPPFRETSFFQNAKKALNPNGALIFNLLAAEGNDATHNAAQEFEDNLRKVFNYTSKLFVDFNYAVVATNKVLPDAEEMKKKIAALNLKIEHDPTHDIEEIY